MNQASNDKVGATLEDLQELDQKHHMHPFTAASSLRQAPPFLIDKAEGCYVSGQGIQLLDMMAGLGCVNVGYGREELANTAQKAMKTLSYYHSFSAVSNPTAAALAGRIAALAPEGMNKVFFANSGSEANETVLKVIAFYWRQKGQPEKRIIITRDYAYHGSTMATTALNGNAAMQEPFGITEGPNVLRAAAPFWYRDGGDMTPEEYGMAAARSIEEKILEAGAENVAAVFVEPVQATMGAIVPPAGYFPEVERICRKHDVLLVADEVVTGLGRTGHWFAQETFGFKADIMTLAKGLSSGYCPISAAVLHDDVAAVIEAGENVFQHGFTTSAHPVMAAVALRNLDMIAEEGLVERIRDDIGPYFAEKLQLLTDSPIVGEVRSCGLIAGIELVRDKETRTQYPIELALCEHVSQAALVRGVIVRATGNALVLCPPYIVTHEEIDTTVNVLRQALEDVHNAIMAE
ncbi:MAG: aminotransferase class III-fold pyridoxal phosphate-dependent enzyme [Kordiimonadaceae bacterium]|nr:aminotransferase class III-fold pyridoxal phosphate-dependent enzyme [Kordiimonadaceae bacterium]